MIKQQNHCIHLYGAGIQSRTIITILEELKLADKIQLYDSNKSKQYSKFCGYEIKPPKDIDNLDSAYVIVTCCFPTQILRDLNPRHKPMSALPFYYQYKCLLKNDNLHSEGLNYSRSKCDIEREFLLYETEINKMTAKLDPGILKLKSVDAVVTEGCSLKCQDCSNLMQYYNKPKSADINLLIESTDRILQSVDHVYEWRILGGEPFIYKDLSTYLDYLSEIPKIGSIIIYTNGTIVPKPELLNSIASSRSFVDISNYLELSRKAHDLIQACKSKDIQYALKDPIWTDSGRIHPHKGESNQQLKEKFFNCCTNDVLTLLHGYIYHCPFSANLINLSSKYLNEKDRISVLEHDPQILRTMLTSFYKDVEYLNSCNFCNGRDYTVDLIDTAIQTRKVLDLPK